MFCRNDRVGVCRQVAVGFGVEIPTKIPTVLYTSRRATSPEYVIALLHDFSALRKQNIFREGTSSTIRAHPDTSIDASPLRP